MACATCPSATSKSAASDWAATSSGLASAAALAAAGSDAASAPQELHPGEPQLGLSARRLGSDKRLERGDGGVEVAGVEGVERCLLERVHRRVRRTCGVVRAAHGAVRAHRSRRQLVGELDDLLDETAQLGLGDRPGEAGDELALPDHEDDGDRLHLERLGEARVGVDVDLDEEPRARVLDGELLQERRELLARPAPLGPEVDDDGDLHGALDARRPGSRPR